jgi:predicted transcriptional regulator
MLSSRQKLILKAIIEAYVKDAQPVGSKLLTQMPYLNFSSATLRYDMAQLEELGYLKRRILHQDVSLLKRDIDTMLNIYLPEIKMLSMLFH